MHAVDVILIEDMDICSPNNKVTVCLEITDKRTK